MLNSLFATVCGNLSWKLAHIHLKFIYHMYIYKSYFIHIVYISPRMFLRVQNVVIPAGGPDQWLEKAYSTQSELMDFARWLEESFESDERLVV